MNINKAVDRFLRTINQCLPPNLDASAVAALYAEDAKQENMTKAFLKDPRQGRAAIEAFYQGFDERMSAIHHEEETRLIEGRKVALELVMQGTRKSSGVQWTQPLAFVLEFDDEGLIQSHRVYFDTAWLPSLN